MLPNRPLRESALPKSEIHVKPFGATRSTFQKAHLCLSSSYAFECDSRDQCLKSKSFFLSQMKAQVKNKTVCQYQSTSSSLHWLAFVLCLKLQKCEFTYMYKYIVACLILKRVWKNKRVLKELLRNVGLRKLLKFLFLPSCCISDLYPITDHAEKKSRRRSPRTTKSIIIPKLPISVIVKICLHVDDKIHESCSLGSWD